MESALWIAVFGLVGWIIRLAIREKRNDKFVNSQLTIEEFKSLDKEAYEIYYIGVREDESNLQDGNFKFISLNEMARLFRLNEVNELPFDNNKLLIIVFEDQVMIKYFEKFAKKFRIKYSSLGDYEMYQKYYA